VSAAASADSSEVFLNRYVEHAAIIVEFLFRKALERVEILTGRLNPVVYGNAEVVRAAIAFLDRAWGPAPSEPALYVLVEDHIEPWSTPLLVAAREAGFLAQTEVRRVPEPIKDSYPFHFMVPDRKHYRCKKSRGVPEAVAQFNEPKMGGTLHSLFDKIRTQSHTLPLEG
jgi:hypothetical protein